MSTYFTNMDATYLSAMTIYMTFVTHQKNTILYFKQRVVLIHGYIKEKFREDSIILFLLFFIGQKASPKSQGHTQTTLLLETFLRILPSTPTNPPSGNAKLSKKTLLSNYFKKVLTEPHNLWYNILMQENIIYDSYTDSYWFLDIETEESVELLEEDLDGEVQWI